MAENPRRARGSAARRRRCACRRRRALALAFALLIHFAAEAPLAAQEAALPPEPLEFSLYFSAGHTFHVNRGRTDATVLGFEPQLAYRLGSRFQWLVEGHYARYFQTEGWAAGLAPIGARYFFGTGRQAFYLDLTAGFLWTNLEVVEIDRRFNFLVQGGPGLRGTVDARHAWFVEVRWVHYSNAGTVPPNLGFNAAVVLGGWKF